MGYGRYIAVRAVNAFAVLLVALLIASTAFNALHEKQLWSEIYERAQNRVREILKAGPPPNKTTEELYWEIVNRLATSYGLNQPLIIRILNATWSTLTLSLGDARLSYPQFGHTRDVKTVILHAMARTALLFTTAQIIVIAIGLLLGLQAARRVGGILDRFISFIAMLSASMPMFWLGMVMIWVFHYVLGLFPPVAWEYIPEEIKANPLSLFTWYVHHMAIPLLTIVIVGFGSIAWITRNIAIGTLQEDFIYTARAKGVPENRVIYGHLLRAISPPITTMSALSIITSLFGAIISEQVFQWPGMGRLYYTALYNGDTKIVIADTFMFVLLFVVVKFILDATYGLLDPRIKASR